MEIQVQIKSVYGNELIYPVCEKAKLFASIHGSKTLPLHVVRDIRGLGYEVRAVQVCGHPSSSLIKV